MKKLFAKIFQFEEPQTSHPAYPFAELTDREVEAVVEGLTFHQCRLLDNDPYLHGINPNYLLQLTGEHLPQLSSKWVWHDIDIPLADWQSSEGNINVDNAYRLLAEIACSIGATPGIVEFRSGYCQASKYGLRVTFTATNPIPTGGLLLLSVESVETVAAS
ncbi:MAG: hypothetical protein OXE04_06620 [bacterium]|nr:hypothetical protein [bacterium]